MPTVTDLAIDNYSSRLNGGAISIPFADKDPARNGVKNDAVLVGGYFSEFTGLLPKGDRYVCLDDINTTALETAGYGNLRPDANPYNAVTLLIENSDGGWQNKSFVSVDSLDKAPPLDVKPSKDTDMSVSDRALAIFRDSSRYYKAHAIGGNGSEKHQKHMESRINELRGLGLIDLPDASHFAGKTDKEKNQNREKCETAILACIAAAEDVENTWFSNAFNNLQYSKFGVSVVKIMEAGLRTAEKIGIDRGYLKISPDLMRRDEFRSLMSDPFILAQGERLSRNVLEHDPDRIRERAGREAHKEPEPSGRWKQEATMWATGPFEGLGADVKTLELLRKAGVERAAAQSSVASPQSPSKAEPAVPAVEAPQPSIICQNEPVRKRAVLSFLTARMQRVRDMVRDYMDRAYERAGKVVDFVKDVSGAVVSGVGKGVGLAASGVGKAVGKTAEVAAVTASTAVGLTAMGVGAAGRMAATGVVKSAELAAAGAVKSAELAAAGAKATVGLAAATVAAPVRLAAAGVSGVGKGLDATGRVLGKAADLVHKPKEKEQPQPQPPKRSLGMER